MTDRKPWSFAVGLRGRAHRVVAFENPQRDWVLALRWHVESADGRKPRYESLGRSLRTETGRIIKDVERWAKSKAQEKHEALMRGEADAALPVAPLTIGETEAVLTDAATGKYPSPSPHRSETLNAIRFAATVWGTQRAWNSIAKADLRALGRARVLELRRGGNTGLAGAEHTVQRVLTVAQWLRDEERIEPGACVAPKNWKEELRSFWLETSAHPELPPPNRPRYTIDDALAIVDAAARVDPRLALMLWIAPNQRLGQVARARRSNVDLARNTVRIPTRGKKRGAVIALTVGERAALDAAMSGGYLRDLEAAYRSGTVADYPLFPSGQMKGGRVLRRGFGSDPEKPRSWRAPDVPVATVERHAEAPAVARKTIGAWFELAEAKAGIAKVAGRGAYGVRRTFVDAGKERKISREGLTALGGWSDPQMADRIYADAEQEYARDEARDVRAAIRGETSSAPSIGSPGNGPNLQQTHNSTPEAEDAV